MIDSALVQRLICPLCGEEMWLSSRSPHRQLGSRYEEQIFTCMPCHVSEKRDVPAWAMARRDRHAYRHPGDVRG